LGGKFQELDGAQRTEFLKPMLEFWFFQYPDGARDFAAGITDPAARLDLGQATPQLVFSGHAAQAMPLLEAIPDPAQRIQMLEAAVPDEQFAKRPDLRSFDVTDEALLREKLAEWEASETQIDAIISRFKP
jgi:hypothetical protein